MSVSLQVKKNMYYAVFRISDANGKEHQKWVSTKIPAQRGNKKIAMRVAQEIYQKYDSAKLVAYPQISFCEWVDLWLKQKKNELDEVTYLAYVGYFNHHIRPYFQNLNRNLIELSPQDIQNYYNIKYQIPGEHVKGKLSGKSLRKHQCIIHGALQDAVRKNMIPYNPADRVTLPKQQKFVGNYYTVEQTMALLEAVKGTILEEIVTLTVFYGLRRSEAVGLKWSAVDFAKNTFEVKFTVVRYSKLVEKEATKNKTSNQTFPMSPEIRDMLLRIRDRQKFAKAAYGDVYQDSGYVFTWEDGRMLAPEFVSRKFSKILKEHNLPHIRYHDLRHTTASMLIAQGYDLKRIQDWLRHSDISTTANIYGHLGFDFKVQTTNLMTDLLSSNKSSNKNAKVG